MNNPKRDPDLCVVTCALSGVLANRGQCPDIPYTPVEIAEEAKRAYEACLSYSSRYQYFDEHSRTCEVWLSKNYATEYHAVDELRGAPSRIDVGFTGQPVGLPTP